MKYRIVLGTIIFLFVVALINFIVHIYQIPTDATYKDKDLIEILIDSKEAIFLGLISGLLVLKNEIREMLKTINKD